MKYCWNEGWTGLKRSFLAIISFFLFAGILACLIYHAYMSVVTWHWTNIFFLPVYCFLFYLGIVLILTLILELRKYSVDQFGIKIRYPFCFSVFYPWDDITEVSICKVHYAPRVPGRYCVAIRCVVGEEKTGPSKAKSANEYWSSGSYEAFHLAKVISIEYTDIRLEQIKSVCPHEIKDYRYLPDC